MKEETITTNQKFDLFKQMLQQKQGKKTNHHFGFNNLVNKLLTKFNKVVLPVLFFAVMMTTANAQITLLQNYQNNTSAAIGTYQGINFREAGFSGLYAIAGTNGKEYWTVSDRGPNVDCANANPAGCHPTYDKMYAFPAYAPKIHRIRLNGDSIQILQTIAIKRPGGTTATGIINPTGLGSTALEVASTDTVLDCVNFSSKTAAKDTFGIDSEGILVDADGNFWLCEEGGPTIWKVNPFGVVIKRFTPYANLAGAQSVDVQIDTVFKYRKNNRGFEGIAMAPNGKIYAIIQSPILYPTTAVGEGTRIHRILEINPSDNSTRMLVYLNDGIIGASGANQIRLRDWKIGDMAAINDSTFLVLEAALRGTTDIKRMYLINISQATNVNSGLYSGVTLEALVDATGLAANGITPVTKTLVMDLLANGWPAVLDKAEGLAIINDSTIAVGNDNDYGQTCPLADGIPIATSNTSHILTYRLQGSNKLQNYQSLSPTLSQGITGPSSSKSPYLLPATAGAITTSIFTVTDGVGGYNMAGIPDGLGAYDNGDGTFTLLMNHEISNTAGAVRAHGSIGAFVSKWIINKTTLAVVSGSDLMQNVNLWNGSSYTTYNAGNPSSLAALIRFCSADLPPVSAFYNSGTGLGTQERIFMNGEEAGTEGRAFGHIVTGANAGTSYQLPWLGRMSFENSVANPLASNKTIVASMDDGATTSSNTYFYIGTKTNTGTEIDKAGLNNGKVYGVKITGFPQERVNSTTINNQPAPGTHFDLVDLGFQQNSTGAALDAAGASSGVTYFSRSEDGQWDPSHPEDFYFVTTDQYDQVGDGVGTQVGRTRLWKLHFTDIYNPELGGTVTAVLDGTEGLNMLDNMTIDHYGHVLLQEDVGNQQHNGKIWQYTIATDSVKLIAKHDVARFGNIDVPATAPYNQDEEASGIIDVQEILGPGNFITVDQTHYTSGIPSYAVEGGQLLSMFNPDTYNANACATTSSTTITACNSYLWNGNTYSTSGTYTYHTLNTSGCDSAATLVLTIVPFTVSSITGPSNACSYTGASGATAIYSIFVVSASSISWSVPANAVITSGLGTNTINVHYLSSFNSGTIAVTVIASCGDTVIRTMSISQSVPSIPPAINGPNAACPYIGTGTLVNYSIAAVSDALSYQWTVPANVTIVSGQGTTGITVIFNNGYVTGNFRVRSHSGCGNSLYRILSVASQAPTKPGVIAGANFAICSPNNVITYNINPVASATSYSWSTNIAGAIVAPNGTSATITFPTFSTGIVSVYATNSCGNSLVRNLNINSRPSVPLSISGNNTVCSGSVQSYSTSAVSGATSYIWSVPPGSSILSGIGTDSISVLIGTTSGNVTVKAVDVCGNSGGRAIGVTVNNCARVEQDITSENISVYPNPTKGLVNLNFTTNVSESYKIIITDVAGKTVYEFKDNSKEGLNEINTDLGFLSKGIYELQLISTSLNYNQKIVLQ